ncbi:uncharacterized protein LDX57_011565 [Aspergillus melleus]|uniref:uncharacterized protein n=1 Tax=Aspergillus melleus TaxID=138277 RepID=UPI001E8EB91B|nr:uncharacterized protein LDX57_011565 [Aspergillus melleus]KAH8433929.1 hypothetical protein LDX57_011565 [Aspergillus melleus]
MDPAIEHTRKDELSDIERVATPMMTKAFIFYETLPTTDLDKVIASFREGLKNATRQAPFVAGDIEHDTTGKPCIMTYPGERTELFLVRRFSTAEHKSFSTLASGAFSPSDFDPDQLLPNLPLVGAKPVCAIQLNIIEGGLILGYSLNHVAGDWTSMDTLLSLICQGSKAHQEGREMPTYTPDLNRGPYNAQFSIKKDNLPEELGMYYVKEKAKVPFIPQPPPPFQTSIYRTTDALLQQLKQRCTPMDGLEYVSSYDCLSALLWTSITRARLQLQPEKSTTPSTCLHPVGLRSRDPEKKTSELYFGNSVFPARVGPTDSQALISENGLAFAASSIRKCIQQVNIDWAGSLASLVASLGPNEGLGYHIDFHDMDVMINSWYSGTAEKYDIGTGSLPAAFRTARPITGGCALVLPNFSKGDTREYEIFVQLESQQHELLRQDAEFAKYFELLA